jgi:hypothetical protein
MLKIVHQINTSKELANIPTEYGIEVDVRYNRKGLMLHHEPYLSGEKLENFCENYEHSFIILNIKNEGIERDVLKILKKYNIEDYFFLDVSFPAIIKLIKMNESAIAMRFSEYEPVESCLPLKEKVDWVWVDCFTKFPLDNESYNRLSKYFKLCLVSPELQKHPRLEIERYKKSLGMLNIELDAVCTDYPQLW